MGSFYLHIALLRGVAILLVLLFHMNPAWCPQGYFGVDLFLVISGYLLIGKQLRSQEPFALGSFVAGRLRRLLPPMLLVCALFGLVEVLVYPRAEWKDYLAEMVTAFTLRANVVLAEGSNDYFAADTRTMPLMHLWYMSMLMQVYLVFSCVFFLWSRLRCSRRGRVLSLGTLAVLSLAIQSRWLVYALGWGGVEWENSVYYWTSARLWEPALGGLLAVMPATRGGALSAVLAWGSLALLVVLALLPLPMSTHWIPVAVLLSLLLVRYGTRFSCRSLLERGLLWVGGISFSLYLVHWPLIACVEYLFFEPLTWGRACVVALGSLVLAWGCCVWGERRVWPMKCLMVGWVCGVLLGMIGLNSPQVMRYGRKMATNSGLTVFSELDVPGNSPLYRGSEQLIPNYWGADKPDGALLLRIGREDAPACFAVVGDSHAQCLYRGMHLVGQQRGWSGVYINSYMKPFYGAEYVEIGVPDHTMTPERFIALEDYLRLHPEIETLIVVQYWVAQIKPHRLWNGQTVSQEDCLEARAAQLREFCRRMQRCGKQVVFTTPTPWISQRNIGRLLRWKCRYAQLNPEVATVHLSREEYDQKAQPMIDLLEELQREGLCRLLHVEEAFFTDGVFEPVWEGQVMLTDDHHLSIDGAVKCVRGVAEALDVYCRAPQTEPAQP